MEKSGAIGQFMQKPEKNYACLFIVLIYSHGKMSMSRTIFQGFIWFSFM